MKFFNYRSGTANYFLAAILLLPAILAVTIVQYFPPPIIDIFVYGGPRVFLYNICVLLLTPYFVIFILALGGLYISRLPNEDLHPLKRDDLGLISFFVGCGFLTVIGFILGLLNLLYFWVCFPIFVIVIYFYFLQPGSGLAAVDLWDWISAKNDSGVFRFGSIILRIVLVTVIASILLAKGILLELFKDGGLHQYFAYFAETRLLHSTWMDPSHPILYDYLAGRGQGVLLFFTAFTNQYTIQIVGVIFLVGIAMLARQVMRLVVSPFRQHGAFPYFQIFPDLVMVLVLTSNLLDMEPARFHLQTGAFFLFLAWSACYFIILPAGAQRWIFHAMLPVVLAYPILGGIFYAFVGWIFAVVLVALMMMRRTASLRHPLILLVFGGLSAAVSLGLNWAYVGVPELQPAAVFQPLILEERFAPWSSKALLFYLDASLSQSAALPSPGDTLQALADGALSLFAYPASILRVDDGSISIVFQAYSLLMIGGGIWLILRLFKDSSQPSLRPVLSYWLVFIALYILKVLLTSVIKQASLQRMLIFLDVIPILVFFSLVVFFLHSAGSFFRSLSLQVEEWRAKVLSVPLNTPLLVYGVSGLFGLAWVLIMANFWPGFWYRPPATRWIFILPAFLLGSFACFFSMRGMVSNIPSIPVENRQIILVFSLVAGLFYFSLRLPASPLSRIVPVPHTVKIYTLDESAPLSDSQIVRLKSLKVNGKNIPIQSLENSGDWQRGGNYLQSDGVDMLIYSFRAGWNAKVEILFESGPDARVVHIEYDGMTPVVKNLYSNAKNDSIVVLAPSLFENRKSVLYAGVLVGAEFLVLLLFFFLLISIFPWRAAVLSIAYLGCLALAFFQFQSLFGFEKVAGGGRFFTGLQGAIPAYGRVVSYGPGSGDRSDVFHCLAIQEAVPGAAQVLNLNGFAAVEPCLFSPLLPRDKLVHHYEAVAITAPYYETLMFGDPETVYPIYRDLGIDYFYIRRGDTWFVNLGYSVALQPENLGKYFDVYTQRQDFIILTWRGEGIYPVSQGMEDQIQALYDASFSRQFIWAKGLNALEEWYLQRP
jgi:hypothetical protein